MTEFTQTAITHYLLTGTVWGIWAVYRQFKLHGNINIAVTGFINTVGWPITMVLAYRNRSKHKAGV